MKYVLFLLVLLSLSLSVLACGKSPAPGVVPIVAPHLFYVGTEAASKLEKKTYHSGAHPFDAGAEISHFILLSQTTFIYYIHENMIGLSQIMFADDRHLDLTPVQIQKAYKLSYLPTHYVLIKFLAGAKMTYGLMNGVMTYRSENGNLKLSQFSSPFPLE